ncbi:hypothetical protein NDU88_003095 [Pleurodeles waltl]|uniref:Uncharacterized protein n=1 Tax=Pleurodeles waltl TaxID=8319 RepID=A0AAV7UBF6_PLEWA|nr:hypothetical protein NDU88_003095 [Pleurodeles waltl]
MRVRLPIQLTLEAARTIREVIDRSEVGYYEVYTCTLFFLPADFESCYESLPTQLLRQRGRRPLRTDRVPPVPEFVGSLPWEPVGCRGRCRRLARSEAEQRAQSPGCCATIVKAGEGFSLQPRRQESKGGAGWGAFGVFWSDHGPSVRLWARAGPGPKPRGPLRGAVAGRRAPRI